MNDSTFSFEKAKAIFKSIEKDLLEKHYGELVAVEPISCEYFMDKDDINVALGGKEKYPDRKFGLFRVGKRSAFNIDKIRRPVKKASND